MVIKWSVSAEKDLENIFQFYVKTASKKVAKQIIEEILFTTNTLKLGLYLGQIEPLLSFYEEGHRYLLSNHNKIIYLTKDEYVVITHVFDTRRNPNILENK